LRKRWITAAFALATVKDSDRRIVAFGDQLHLGSCYVPVRRDCGRDVWSLQCLPSVYSAADQFDRRGGVRERASARPTSTALAMVQNASPATELVGRDVLLRPYGNWRP